MAGWGNRFIHFGGKYKVSMKMYIEWHFRFEGHLDGTTMKKRTLCEMTIPHVCFSLGETLAHIPKAACAGGRRQHSVTAQPGNNPNAHQTERGWTDYIKSILRGTLQPLK